LHQTRTHDTSIWNPQGHQSFASGNRIIKGDNKTDPWIASRLGQMVSARSAPTRKKYDLRFGLNPHIDAGRWQIRATRR
jgi:hypothetical protein